MVKTFIAIVMGAMTAGAVPVADLGRDGVAIAVDAEPEVVDVARDFVVTLTCTAPAGTPINLPDLRDRFSGFRVAEEFTEDPVKDADGKTTLVSRWKLVPMPVAKKYRLAPFVVNGFCTAPVYFKAPPAREAVTGDMEVEPKKDLPPLSWKLVGWCALALAAVAGVVCGIWWTVKKIREAIRVHRMSPIERAYYELDKLLQKGLPGKGFYKDFYVELTMVVRRYVERKYGVKAPNMTTQEFLGELARRADDATAVHLSDTAALKAFLESADLVKFAGVEATPEMADTAAGSARTYLDTDNTRIQNIPR